MNRHPDVSMAPRVGRPLHRLNPGFFNQLDQLLTPAERQHYRTTRVGIPQPETHADHDAGLAPEKWTADANRLCHQINLWGDEEPEQLPDQPIELPGKKHPLIHLYPIIRVTSHQDGTPQQITLDEACKGRTDTAANYETGSVLYGPAGLEHVPTSPVILEGTGPALPPSGAASTQAAPRGRYD